MEREYHLTSDERKLWANFYQQVLTFDGQEATLETDGTKTLVLLPMLTYTLISTMIQKLKYLPVDCFNQMKIGDTPISGLRQTDENSPPVMIKMADIIRVIMDGVRKQQILSVTMMFYQNNDITHVYDSYSLIFDYETMLPKNQSTTSLETIANVIHQIEYMFEWNDALPNDVELTFAMSVRDQFDNDEQKVPSPFYFMKPNLKKVYEDNQTKYLLGRLTTPNGKIWLKFLPSHYQLSGSTVRSEDLPTKANIMGKSSKKTKTKSSEPADAEVEQPQNLPTLISPTLKRKTKRSSITADSNTTKSRLPSLISSIASKTKKGTGLLAAFKSLITPSRTPAPVTSSTPNPAGIVLIEHTSTPKPGETASRIIIGKSNSQAEPLSAITKSSANMDHPSSPTLSVFTTTDLSTSITPTIDIDPRSSTAVRAPTARGQAAMARRKIAEMQIRDDSSDSSEQTDKEDDNEEFTRLFTRRKSKKVKKPTLVLLHSTKDQSDISSVSSSSSNVESLFTPPTGRKRPAVDRSGLDDLTFEHGTPPKTPRTSRRNRLVDESSRSPMDIGDLHVTVDSPRLLRSVTKKLQQQASDKKCSEIDAESSASEKSKSQDTSYQESDIDRAYVSLQKSSVGLHYSMEDSD